MEESRHSFIDHIGVVMAGVVREGIEDHEARMHLQPGMTQPPEPGACPQGPIPGPVLANMADIHQGIRSPDFAISLLARIFGYPEEQVARELDEWYRQSERGDDGACATA